MRYFIELSYDGTHFSGWQRQPNAGSVQATIEDALSLILRTPIEIIGCGRTDAGVHAAYYVAHFDFSGTFPEGFLSRVNKFLPPTISIFGLRQVADEAHARFDAVERGYTYYLTTRKDPFRREQAYYFPFFAQLNQDKTQATAALLLQYGSFYPFCKTNNDAKTMDCKLTTSTWTFEPDLHQAQYRVVADRFLRGMVRLIVGTCLNVGLGKLELADVQLALEGQTRLPKAWSVPPQGLFLDTIKYPYIEH